jgi:hypothetical protein
MDINLGVQEYLLMQESGMQPKMKPLNSVNRWKAT